jgi:hypothetical protein
MAIGEIVAHVWREGNRAATVRERWLKPLAKP